MPTVYPSPSSTVSSPPPSDQGRATVRSTGNRTAGQLCSSRCTIAHQLSCDQASLPPPNHDRLLERHPHLCNALKLLGRKVELRARDSNLRTRTSRTPLQYSASRRAAAPISPASARSGVERVAPRATRRREWAARLRHWPFGRFARPRLLGPTRGLGTRVWASSSARPLG